MYLEPTHALGAPANQVQCNDGTFDVSNGIVAPCRTHGGVKATPVLGGAGGLVKSPALYSYDLTGTATAWSYPLCKTGYTRKLSGKPHPNYYTCFKG